MSNTAFSTVEFDRLAALAKNDPTAFEQERTRLIQDYIATLPAEKQAVARSFQNDLDLKRLQLSSGDFITYCATKMQDNFAGLQHLANELQERAKELV
jgi:hypothetical protein